MRPVSRRFALEALRQWVREGCYKATREEIAAGVSWAVPVLDAFLEKEDFHFKEPHYVLSRDVFEEVLGIWKREGWVYGEETRRGRPRKAEYSAEVKRKAERYFRYAPIVDDLNDKEARTVKWSQSVLGEGIARRKFRYVVNVGETMRALMQEAGLQSVHGMTREEIAERLEVPKKFVSRACREMAESGECRIVRTNRNGVRRREVHVCN